MIIEKLVMKNIQEGLKKKQQNEVVHFVIQKTNLTHNFLKTQYYLYQDYILRNQLVNENE